MRISTHGSYKSAIERESRVSNLKPLPSEINDVFFSVNSPDDSRVSVLADDNDKWNVAVILGGDGEFHLSKGPISDSALLTELFQASGLLSGTH